jgi:peptidoglycan/xylan/chitin deacetylase (PgdA/CDA1 family)
VNSFRIGLTAIAFLAFGPPAHATPVALTFDDLPMLGVPGSIEEADKVTDTLLRRLRSHHLPAIGFVNEGKLAGPEHKQRVALLQKWIDAGEDLGNHSYSHVSLTNTPVEAYIADVARGDVITRELLAKRGRKPHWYRHPFLETGPTAQIRETFQKWLKQHGYKIAPVTMENSDWMFALVYDQAVRKGDHAEAARIRTSYLDYTRRVVPWYRTAAIAVLGREPSYVFLLHASRLNADTLDALVEILDANDLRGASLAKAMKDPAYKIADTYAGPNGIGWIERWSMTLHKNIPWSTAPQEPADITTADKKLDAEISARISQNPSLPHW